VKKRRLIMALAFLAFVWLMVSLACGEAPKATPVVIPPTPEEAVATSTPAPAPVGTSLDNPVPLGHSLVASNGAKITINGITARGAEATAIVKRWNEFNPEPGEGKEYIIISCNVAYEGGKGETVSVARYDFRVVVKGVIKESPTMMIITGGDLLEGEMFPGASIDGHLVFEVDEGATGIVVVYTVLFEESYYFATE